MNSDTPLDYAVFQLSPRRSRCELFASSYGITEKLAAGYIKPFVTHLKTAEEQISSAAKSIKLEVKRYKGSESWFTKGTLERFVRFVSTPEVLELVGTYDAEMSQLEAARKIYSQGPIEGSGGEKAAITASDATKKELVRAIDVRLVALGQDLSTACSRALAAGFNPDTVSELQQFAEQFGAFRLSQSCSKFMFSCQRRPELFSTPKCRIDDQVVRSSYGSDMSLDDQVNQLQTGSSLEQLQPSHPENLDELNSTTFQPENTPSAMLPSRDSSSRESSVDKIDMKESSNRNMDKEPTSSGTDGSKSLSAIPCPPARRLSVQDRINMFENKQRANSPSSGQSKPAVGKSVEFRRLSSDVSSVGQTGPEKAALRRWSGASDMSIDLGGEGTEVGGFVGTPAIAMTRNSSSSMLSEDMDTSDLDDSVISLRPENKIVGATQVKPIRLENQSNLKKEEVESKHARTELGAQLTVSSGGSSEETSESKSTSHSGKSESGGRQDQFNFLTQSKMSFGRPEDSGLEDQIISPTMPRGMKQFASRAQASSSPGDCPASSEDCVARKGQLGVSGMFSHVLSDCETRKGPAECEDMGSRNQHDPSSNFRTSQRALIDRASDSDSSPVSSVSVVSHIRGNEFDQFIDSSRSSFSKQGNGVERKEYESNEKLPENSSVVKKSRGRRDGRGSGMGVTEVAGEAISDDQETCRSLPTSMEEAERLKQSKGNQELNDELKLKANELEKLFAEHKLRTPGNQPGVTRMGKFVEKQEQEACIVSRDSSAGVSTPQVPSEKVVSKPSHSGNTREFSSSPAIQPLENQGFDGTPKQNIFSLGVSDDSRGNLYDKYTLKRDAKLREEWSSNRAEKEAQMRAMHDSFERSRTEMKTKLAGSASRQDTLPRAENLGSFNARSAVRRKQPVHSFLDDEGEDQAEFARNVQDRKDVLMNNNAASSILCAAGSPGPRISAKASGPSAGRRKLQPENPFAQPVPNFSDFRKENTKPSTMSSQGIGRSQVGHTIQKNSSEDALSLEGISQRPQYSRKSSANPLELKDLPSLNSEGTDHEDEFPMSTGAGSFLMKGSASSIPRSKASLASKTSVNGKDFIDISKEQEVFDSVADEEYENMGSVKSRSRVYIKSPNSVHQRGDATGFPSRATPVAEMPVSVLELPGESPGSWHSRIHNPYPFQHEISNFEASVDSPVGSPAYWNSNDSDAGRTRKKWGAAQKPDLVSDLSHVQSRKDVPKGIKRFLKFGRKNRGTDSVVDWVSATTSEGDDDTEDGKDPSNRSSDDLKKSRMGFSPFNPDDGFSETDYFSGQVHGYPSSIPTPPLNYKLREDHLSGSALKAPKSFFSLSTFRSKGSDSKPR